MANSPFGVPIRHSLLAIRLLSACAIFLNERNNHDTRCYFRKEKSSSDFQAAKAWPSGPAATRAKAARQGNGCETAFSAARTGNEFRPNRGNASAVTADQQRINSGINST